MSHGRPILPIKRPVKSVSHLYKCMHLHTRAHAYETDTAATLDDKPNQIYQPETQI